MIRIASLLAVLAACMPSAWCEEQDPHDATPPELAPGEPASSGGHELSRISDDENIEALEYRVPVRFSSTPFAQTGDLDGDGVGDLVLVDPRIGDSVGEGRASRPMLARAISGATGETLWEWPFPGSKLATSLPFVCAWNDWDGDGPRDVVVGWTTGDETSPKLQSAILSGASGQFVAKTPGAPISGVWAVAVVPAHEGPAGEAFTSRVLILRRKSCRAIIRNPKGDSIVTSRWSVLAMDHYSGRAHVGTTEFAAAQDDFFYSRPTFMRRSSERRPWGVAYLSGVAGASRVTANFREFTPELGVEEAWSLAKPTFHPNTYARGVALEQGVDESGASKAPVLAVVTRARTPMTEFPALAVLISSEARAVIRTASDHGPSAKRLGCEGLAGWGCEFGAAAASDGDPDRDGLDRLLVGSPKGAYSEGGVIRLDAASPIATRIPSPHAERHARFGSAIATGYDYNGDGVNDYVIGESWWNNVNKDGALVIIQSGADFSLIRKISVDG